MKTIGITGGSGFVGTHLTDLLIEKGHNVIIFTRSTINQPKKPNIRYSLWEPHNGKCDLRLLKEIDAVVNLAGAGITDKRWTANRKKEIVDSRVESTNFLVQRLRDHAPQCKTFISASATGFYGPDEPGKIPFKEDAAACSDFLGQVCDAWEKAAHEAEAFERTTIFRFGIVLGKDGGAYKALAAPVSYGIMPILGSGKQMVSWIHIDDVSEMICHSIGDDSMHGIYNAVAPTPVTHKELMQSIARSKTSFKIPVPVPGFILKPLIGGAATEVLKSCTASADKILTTGYKFKFESIDKAMNNLAGKN